MEKTIPGMSVLFYRHELKSPAEIGMYAGKDIPALQRIADQNGYKAVGPVQHAYWNMSVKGVPHILEVWLPVSKQGGEHVKEYKVVEPFKCLIMPFADSLEKIGDAWGEFGKVASSMKAKSTHHDREVYHVLDFERPSNNRIELQMGIE